MIEASTAPSEARDAALVAEAKRINLRYVVEFVEAYNLCPWAERARLDGHVAQRVCLDDDLSLEGPLAIVDEVARDPSIEVGLLIFPRLDVDRREFERFVGRLRTGDAARAGLGGPALAMAAFHPVAEPATDSPYRLVPFIRRSPDPTIQLVRRSVLDAIRRPGDHGTDYVDPTKVDILEFLSKKRRPPLHERVAQANLETLVELGLDRACAVLDAIVEDRDRAYAALGERPRTHTETPPV
ncbi:MAG: DUF1415 family protein [Polyangiales bacterium]